MTVRLILSLGLGREALGSRLWALGWDFTQRRGVPQGRRVRSLGFSNQQREQWEIENRQSGTSSRFACLWILKARVMSAHRPPPRCRGGVPLVSVIAP